MGKQAKTSLPHEFRQIRLELAREPGHPGGSNATGYDVIAPLDGSDRLSADIWRTHKDACRVRRFHEGEDDHVGHLARRPGGAWYFDYDESRAEDDETGHRLGDERFVLGEYVSVKDEHGRMHTYRVVSVRPL
jgi:hypothetical protein